MCQNVIFVWPIINLITQIKVTLLHQQKINTPFTFSKCSCVIFKVNNAVYSSKCTTNIRLRHNADNENSSSPVPQKCQFTYVLMLFNLVTSINSEHFPDKMPTLAALLHFPDTRDKPCYGDYRSDEFLRQVMTR